MKHLVSSAFVVLTVLALSCTRDEPTVNPPGTTSTTPGSSTTTTPGSSTTTTPGNSTTTTPGNSTTITPGSSGTTALGQVRPTGIFVNPGSWQNNDSLRTLYALAARTVLKLSRADMPDVELALAEGRAVSPTLTGILPLLNEDILVDLLTLVRDNKFKDISTPTLPNNWMAAANQQLWGRLTPPWRSAVSGAPSFFWWIGPRLAPGEVAASGEIIPARPAIALCVGPLDANGEPVFGPDFRIVCYLRRRQ